MQNPCAIKSYPGQTHQIPGFFGYLPALRNKLEAILPAPSAAADKADQPWDILIAIQYCPGVV